jgi:transcriptional regulator with XRE-family HTH domain
MLALDQADLAKAANVSRNVVIDFEKKNRKPTANNVAAIQRALESAGVEFIGAIGGGGLGVRLAKEAEND